MSHKQPVLPNFIRTVLFATAATLSMNAFAGHHEKGEAMAGDLKDMSSESKDKMKMAKDKVMSEMPEEEMKAEAAEAKKELMDKGSAPE